MARNKLRIGRVWVEWRRDEDPDLSFLGEYADTATSSAAIDREARGDKGNREFRFFNPAMTGDETGNPDSPEEDYRRMEAYNRGDWCMVGCVAKAEVLVPSGAGCSTVQVIHSGGLWGIESDCGDDYRAEVQGDELEDLARQLDAFGLGRRAIAHGVKGAEVRE